MVKIIKISEFRFGGQQTEPNREPVEEAIEVEVIHLKDLLTQLPIRLVVDATLDFPCMFCFV